ncbi:MAG: ornithine cyclodeaminase family protein [Acidimicrobiales bacterium]
MLVLSQADVDAVLDLDRLVDAVAAAMVDLSAGRASVPPRVAATVPERNGLLVAMPAFLPSAKALTTKLVSLFPENRDIPTHQAIICCFDPETGTPLAVLDGRSITSARTAAGSVIATRLLARPDASVVAILGTGVQARAHLRAMARAVPGARFLVAGRDHDEARAVVAELGPALTAALEVAPSFEAAVRRADIVCATTHAAEPVVRREWLGPGRHVNSVGYNTEGEGEVDAATVAEAVVVVESRAAALAPPPAGAVELRRAVEAGVIGPEHVRAELGELLAGTAVGRTSRDELTLYKSVGVAVQDAAAAALVLEFARNNGAGIEVPI